MCSQFEVKAKLADIAKRADAIIAGNEPAVVKEHIYPYDPAWVVVRGNGENNKVLTPMNYSLVAGWSIFTKSRRGAWLKP